jgi:mono/diheme cytochrome c family protein
MRKIIGTLVGVTALGALGGIGFVYSGAYDIGADQPHWAMTSRFLEIVRIRSVKAHAANIALPSNLGDQARILAGAVHFASHCAICHSAPGVAASDLAEGMYPKPPELTHAPGMWSARELFWIVKHGIKMTGMPSWADHGDDQLWNSVAFLQKLPSLTPDSYKQLLESTKEKGIGHQMNDMPMQTPGTSHHEGTTPSDPSAASMPGMAPSSGSEKSASPGTRESMPDMRH